MNSRSGFTVVELLVAAAVLLIILGALGAIYVATSRAYETNRAVTAAAGQMRGAIAALQRDVSQAGFTGRDPAALGALSPFQYELGPDSCFDGRCGRELEGLTVRYVVSAETGGLHTVRYSVTDGYLLQSTGGGIDLPLAEGITGLDAMNYVRADGSTSSTLDAPPADVKGLELRIRFLQGQMELAEHFTVVTP